MKTLFTPTGNPHCDVLHRLVLLPALLLALLAWSPSAFASGISLNRFGGIFGHANAMGGLSPFWNPALVSAHVGTSLVVDVTGVSRNATYDRRIYEDERERPDRVGNPFYNDPGVQETNVGLASTSTLAALPYLGMSHAFDLRGGVRLGFGLALHPAFGGTAAWDKNPNAPSEFPGGLDGTQRWSGLTSTFLILHATPALSLTLVDHGLSFGMGLALVHGDISTTRARNVNRGEQPVDADGFIQEGRIFFEGSDQAVSPTVGVSWLRGPVRMSAHYRSGYNLNIRGDLRQAYATQPLIQVRAFLDFPTPHMLLNAVTVEQRRWTATLATDYSVWSRMRSNIIFVETDPPDQLLEIPRNLMNTFSVRGLGTWRFHDRFELAASLGYDPSAVPADSIDAALSDARKWQVGAGIRTWQPGRWNWMLSYSQDIYQTVESVRSVHEPTANGTYRDARRWLNLSVEFRP